MNIWKLNLYLMRLFMIRLFMCALSVLMAAMLVEIFLQKKHPELAFLKLPFILHKCLPFLVFIATLLFLWRLIRFHELDALSSIGLSLWQILSPPFGLAVLLGLGDLLVLAPLSQNLLLSNVLKEKVDRISFQNAGWRVFPTQNHYDLVYLGNPYFHQLTFSSSSQFQSYLWAERFTQKKNKLMLQDCWESTPNPQKTKDKTLSFPLYHVQRRNPHPFFMSFIEVQKELFVNQQQRRALLFRHGYLLSNMLWILTLILFAASVIVGPIGGKKRILHVGIGILTCFALFMGKEWIFALSIPLSNWIQPMIVWMTPLLTLLIAVLCLFEKHEL